VTAPAVKDERVAAAAAHWSLRFVSNGVELGTFQATLGRITTWDRWCEEWGVSARRYEETALKAEGRGEHETAGQAWLKAAMCWHFGKFLFMDDLAQQRAAHDRTVECFKRGMSVLDPPGERVLVPYEGTQLAGVLRRPRAVANPPVVIMVPGLDSTKEEIQSTADYFLRRGLATLAVDGPGQGEAEYELRIEPAYERVARAIVDWVEADGRLDASRIGFFGVSLGGYYALRAAAHEARLRACVGLAGPFDFGAVWEQLPVVTKAAFRQRSGATSDDDARTRAGRLTLAGIEALVSPCLVVHGKLDRIIPYTEAERIARIRGAELITYEKGNHGITDEAFASRSLMADWLASELRQ
jgi:dienelactone hydrolase